MCSSDLLHPGDPIAGAVLQHAAIAKGMKEEQLELQRERIARDPGRVAAFERGLAEGGYAGAQVAIADLFAARYEQAKGVPDAGSRTGFLPVTLSFRYVDGGEFQRAWERLLSQVPVVSPGTPVRTGLVVSLIVMT